MLADKFRLVSLFIIVLLVNFQSDSLAEDAPSYLYGVMETSYAGDQVTLHLINPDSPDQFVASRKIGVPPNSRLGQTNITPNGRWLALRFTNSDTGQETIQLWDLYSDEVRLVTDSANGRHEMDDQMFWSPDSKYIIFRAVFPDWDATTDEPFRVFIYGFDHANFGPIRVSSVFTEDIVWSDDGERVAIESGDTLHTFNVRALYPGDFIGPTLNLHGLSDYVLNAIARLKWSPDHNRIQFIRSFGNWYSSEIDVWDLEQSTTMQLTNFLGDFDPNTDFFRSQKDSFWLDADDIIVGAYHAKSEFGSGIIPETLIIGTNLYNLSDGTVTNISDRALFGFSPAPDRNLVAYLDQDIILKTWSSDDLTAAFENVETVVSHMTSSDLPEIGRFPPGCEFTWSPDSAYLSYANIINDYRYVPGGMCGEINTLYFVDAQTQQYTTYQLPAESDLMRVGWVIPNTELDSQGDAGAPLSVQFAITEDTPTPLVLNQ